MRGRIVDALLVAASKQRNANEEKQEIKEGRIAQDWKDRPAKLRQKDRDARWTVKFFKAKERADESKPIDIAIPTFGYKNHILINRRYGFIRRWLSTDAAPYDGARLREGLLDKPIRRAQSGRTPLIDRRPARHSCKRTALSAASIARSRSVALCLARS